MVSSPLWRTGCTGRGSRLDHDFAEARPAGQQFEAEVTVSGSDMTIDLTGCEKQRKGSINARTLAGAYVAYKALTTPTGL